MSKTCPCCGQTIRAAKPKAIAAGNDPLAILQPVGRKKIGKDKVSVVVATTFRDGEEMRFTVARNPKDPESKALETGRRLAVLARVADTPELRAYRATCAEKYQAAFDDALSNLVRERHFDRDDARAVALARLRAGEVAFAYAPPPVALEWQTLPNGRRVLAPPAAAIARAIADVVTCDIAAPAIESLYAAE